MDTPLGGAGNEAGPHGADIRIYFRENRIIQHRAELVKE